MKDIIIRAVEREIHQAASAGSKSKRVELPLIRTWKGRKLDLTNFDFDELLG